MVSLPEQHVREFARACARAGLMSREELPAEVVTVITADLPDHGDPDSLATANAAPGDDLLHEVLATFARHGLDAHFDEGRIEVAAHWHRRGVP